MRVLLIWQEIPEMTKYFVLNDPSNLELATLGAAHCGLINDMDNNDVQEAALPFLNAALTDPKYATDKAYYAEMFDFIGDIEYWLSRWFDKEVDEQSLLTAGPFDQVVVSGFLMSVSL